MRGRRSRGLLIVAVVTLLIAPIIGSTSHAGVTGPPAIGYWTDTNAVIADGTGTVVRTFPNFERFSFNQTQLAGAFNGNRPERSFIVGYDIASGEPLFRIWKGYNPVHASIGKRIAFFPTFKREQFTSSVWMRMGSGKIRKVIMFKPGPGRPGIPHHGFRAGGSPLEFALDRRGRTMAVAYGLETIRTFDVWVVDVGTKQATRMTRGERSHIASLTPDGNLLVVEVESREMCPDPIYGEFPSKKIRVISTETGERKTLTEFGCEFFYSTPRWLDNNSLLATRVTKDETQEFGYNLDLVKFDVTTGDITEVVTEGNPCCTTSSPLVQKVAYQYSDKDGFSVFDLGTSTPLDFPPNNYVPHLAGESRHT
jgi:hypothetical protein